jgi:hypothetical protein
MEHAFDADVLIHVRPVDTLTSADETKVGSLLRCGV